MYDISSTRLYRHIWMGTYIQAYDAMKGQIIEAYIKYSHIQDRKEYAALIKQYHYSSVLFRMKDGQSFNTCINEMNMPAKIRLLMGFVK